MDNRPIGVFDSGLGGLTVVRELKKLLPNNAFQVDTMLRDKTREKIFVKT